MDHGINGRVQEILRASGQTQSEFAAALATTPSKLSKSLSDQRRFTTTELALAAELGHTTVDWILTGKNPPSYQLAARAQETAVGTEVRTIVQRLHDAHGILHFDSPQRLPHLPNPNKNSAMRDIDVGQHLAAMALQRFDADSHVQDNHLDHSITEAFGIDVAFVDLPAGVSGAAWATDDFRVILVNRRDSLVRRRFTIAHELGHILAGHASDLVTDDSSKNRKSQPERLANAFAAAFLMPESEIRRIADQPIDDDAFARLAVALRVSPLSLSYRLLNLGFIAEPQQQRFGAFSFADCITRADASDEAQNLALREKSEQLPERLVSGLVDRYITGESTAAPLAQLLGRSTDEVRALFARQD
ncbi:hypothetical protein GCM10027591_12920 [Zhihengliuella somnathii]